MYRERNNWKRGDHLVVDDETGFVEYASNMVRRWDGAIVRRDQDEPIEPQWFIRSRPDPRPVSPVRTEPRPSAACETIPPYDASGGLRPISAATHLFVGASIGTMEIECSFMVYPDEGPFYPE